jgi:hypothetical protein
MTYASVPKDSAPPQSVEGCNRSSLFEILFRKETKS